MASNSARAALIVTPFQTTYRAKGTAWQCVILTQARHGSRFWMPVSEMKPFDR